MTEKQLTEIIQKYLSGVATEEEKKKVEEWYDAFDTLEMGFDEKENKNSFLRSWLKIKERIAEPREAEAFEEEEYPRFARRVVYKWVAVAAMLILVSGTVYFLFQQREAPLEVAEKQIKEDFQPGGNKAVLTLGNGQKIVLDSSNKGVLSMQGNTKILKLNKGLLSYKTESEKQSVEGKKQEVTFNTISTPRGGKYEVVLPDGSKVWLNAASSLRFPTAFAGNKREVTMTGEAYFEISQNAKKPFIVKKGKTEVKVLGTHFNVMAYEDEAAMRVTLLEGSVKVSDKATHQSQLLKPGEQLQLSKGNGEMKLIGNVNLNKATAWKDNLFWFEDDDVDEVMKKLARWYDVDIKIEGDISDQFTGSIPRQLAFSQVIGVLQKTGSIHYKIQDKKTIIITL